MKRLTLTTAVLAILMAPAAFAQSTLNTTAPGASQETKPGQTNNNLQNPGSKMAAPPATTTTTTTTEPSTATVQEPAPAPAPEATGTMNSTDTTTTTTGTTYTAPTTDTTTGTMNNDTTSTSGAYTGSTSTTTTSKLPKTASELPTVMMAGLLALFAAFALRFYSKRNA